MIRNKNINWANGITLFRILVLGPLAVLLLVWDKFWWLLGTIIVFFVLDKVDGYVAKRLNCMTRLGIILDSLADLLGLLIILTYFKVNLILSWFWLGMIILPKGWYYLGVYLVDIKYNKHVNTQVYKFSLLTWLILFLLLLIWGYHSILVIVFIGLLYLITLIHFIISLRYLEKGKESKLISKVTDKSK